VIISVTNVPEVSFLKSGHGLDIGPENTIRVDPQTLATNRPGVFAAGDATHGPDVLIQAIADGKRAALSIDRYLRGSPLVSPEDRTPNAVVRLTADQAIALSLREGTNSGPRQEMPIQSPAERIRDFGEAALGLTEEQARAEARRCLQCGLCADCGLCVRVCEPGAIDLNMRDETIELDVGAIVLATGFDPFDPSVIMPYGYGRYPNVITSLEFERLVNALGPTRGQLLRPSDGTPVKRLALIQCVGSRDIRYNAYCSSVCCRFATQEAIVAYEHDPEVQSTIYYMDLRATGKAFEQCLDRAKNECGVKYVRAHVAEVTQTEDLSPMLKYEDTQTGRLENQIVDLVVLVVGLEARRSAEEMAALLDVELEDGSFVKTDPFLPMDTTCEGVFACGFCRGPADITQSVAQGSAAAARAAEFVMKG